MNRPPPYIADCEDASADLAELCEIHLALVAAEHKDPRLKESPRWQMMRADAYEAFMTAWWGGR